MTANASPEETPGNAKPKTTLLLPLILAGFMPVALFWRCARAIIRLYRPR